MPRIMNNAPKIFVYLSRAPSMELPLFLLQYESAFEAEPLIAPVLRNVALEKNYYTKENTYYGHYY